MRLVERPYRSWINQPSTLQPLNYMNGMKCIVVDTGEDKTVTVFFTEGCIVSMEVPRLCIAARTDKAKR